MLSGHFKTMKKLLLFIFGMLAAFYSEAQQEPYLGTYNLRFYPGGQERFNPGVIRYNFGLSKFEFREGAVWVQLGGGGGGLADGDKGDITVSGVGASWFIDNGAVTLSKFQNISTTTILGRLTAGTGLVETLSPEQLTTMLPLATSALKGLVPPSGGGSTNFLRGDLTWADPAIGAGGGTTETASNGLNKVGSDIRAGGLIIQDTELSISSSNNDFGIRSTVGNGSGLVTGIGYATGGGFALVSGDFITKAGTYAYATAENAGGKFYNELANGENVTLLVGAGEGGSHTFFTDNRTIKRGIQYASSGYETQPTSLTTVQWVQNLVNTAINSTVPNGDKGDITVTNGGATWTVDPDAVTFSKFQNIAGTQFLGRSSSVSGDMQEINATTATSMLNTFSTTARGLVPISPGGTSAYLRADMTWQTPPTGGSTPGVFTSSVNGLAPASGGGTLKYLRSDATWTTFPTIPVVSAGTYVPTVGASSNTSNIVLFNCIYHRTNNVVEVKGHFTSNNATLSQASISITLPSGMGEPLDVEGVVNAIGTSTNSIGWATFSSGVTDYVVIQYIPTQTVGMAVHFAFSATIN